MQPPSVLHPWLIHHDSLTEKLQTLSTDTRLDVRRHEWSPSDPWDKQRLNMTEDALHREILMWASNTLCWYARTVIPQSTYQAEATLFDRLKTTPLGELIWNHPHIKRESMVHFPIHPDTMEYHFLTENMHENNTLLWARLSTLSVHQTHPFYLLEIFLPGLTQLCSPSHEHNPHFSFNSLP